MAPATAPAGGPLTLDDAPPPLSGGTLLATRDRKWVVASDPDRDRIYLVSTKSKVLEHTLKLEPGAEPGRLAEDADGRVHVVLRGGNDVVSFSPGRSELRRRRVCDIPRGIAYEAQRDELHVACVEGTLVTLAADPTSKDRREVELGRDLRDVIVHDGKLFVTRFRSAELLELNDYGAVVGLSKPPRILSDESNIPSPPETSQDCLQPLEEHVSAGNSYSPSVAWRTIDLPGVGIAMLHQQSNEHRLGVKSGGYGINGVFPTGPKCGQGPVRSALTLLGAPPGSGGPLGWTVLAIDVAVSPNGAKLAVAAPGFSRLAGMPQVTVLGNPRIGTSSDGSCVDRDALQIPSTASVETSVFSVGQVTSVVFVSDDLMALQSREPAEILFVSAVDGHLEQRVVLGQPSRFDYGHVVFHAATLAGAACASCHAEAMDDGQLWDFQGIGLRRTQTLRGGILGSEPLHWNGDMHDFSQLVDEVLGQRMSGFPLDPDKKEALAAWIDRQPALRASVRDRAAAERGQALFESAEVGCSSCHSGPMFTNNETVDVGTGAAFQVPMLRNVSFRTPIMHDGCAQTLRDRFGKYCGGDQHGHTSQLSESELGDLIAYLETL